MKLVGESVYLSPDEESLLQMTSPVAATVAFKFSDTLLAKSSQLAEVLQDKLKNQAETYDETRWHAAKLVGRALSKRQFRMAQQAIVPAIKQAIKPDSLVLEQQIDEISNEALAYGNLGNALKRAEREEKTHLIVADTETDVRIATNDMLQDIDAYLITSAMDIDES